MSVKTLLSVYGVVAAVFCLGLLLFPAFWITLYGAHADTQATLLLRLVGALFGGPAVMAWMGRNAVPSKARDAMVLGFAVANGLAAVVALLGARSGVYNQFAWGPVATFALCAIGFLLVERPGMSASAHN
jgi:hypothetical protein